jgi:hypothetical protein
VTADLAVVAMAVVSLASIGRDYRLHRKALEKMGDRLRLVNPPKAPEKPDEAAANTVDLDRRRAG